MTDIEQQARKENRSFYRSSCGRIVQRVPGQDEFGDPQVTEHYMPVEAAMAMHEELGAALLSERSRPNPLHEELGFARIEIDALKARLKGCEDALEQRDAANPSLMVGFSEEEMHYLFMGWMLENHEANEMKDESDLMRDAFLDALRYANTRAVSIDRIMEVVKPYASHKPSCLVATTMLTSNPPQPGPDVPGTCTCGLADLRERLMKIMP